MSECNRYTLTYVDEAPRRRRLVAMGSWNALLPLRQPAEQLKDDIKIKYLIIGAGFAGLAAARRLADLDPSSRIAVVGSDSKRWFKSDSDLNPIRGIRVIGSLFELAG
jgi:hypothetical protein